MVGVHEYLHKKKGQTVAELQKKGKNTSNEVGIFIHGGVSGILFNEARRKSIMT